MLLAVWFSLWGNCASADPQSKSFSSWTYHQGLLRATYTIASREVTRLAAYQQTAGAELNNILIDHLASRISVNAGGNYCESQGLKPQRAREGYIRLTAEWLCPSNIESVEIGIRALLDEAPGHIHFALFKLTEGYQQEQLYTRRSSLHTLDFGSSAEAGPQDKLGKWSDTLQSYTLFGFEHILIGLDHIAFLLALLLLSQRLRDVIFIVTGFTLGHSMTLSLTVLGWVTPDLMVVEALIGFTIAVVAVENVSVRSGGGQCAAVAVAGTLALAAGVLAISSQAGPVISLLGLALFSYCYLRLGVNEARARQYRPMITSLFGLIHGFGFASVLMEAGLPEQALAPALLGFNIGVEMGQIAIVTGCAATVATATQLMTANAQKQAAQALNVSLCALGSYWFVQRLF